MQEECCMPLCSRPSRTACIFAPLRLQWLTDCNVDIPRQPGNLTGIAASLDRSKCSISRTTVREISRQDTSVSMISGYNRHSKIYLVDLKTGTFSGPSDNDHVYVYVWRKQTPSPRESIAIEETRWICEVKVALNVHLAVSIDMLGCLLTWRH